MGLKPDHWIARMAREERMIEPYEEGKAREGVISCLLCGRGPKELRYSFDGGLPGRCLHHPAELLRAGAHR
jgi:hypothetical protein